MSAPGSGKLASVSGLAMLACRRSPAGAPETVSAASSAMPGSAPTSTRSGQAARACPAPFMTGSGCSGRLCPGRSNTGPAVTLATLPHLGQAPAPPLNEKRRPQKHATSVIIDTFLSLRPLRCGGLGDGSGTGLCRCAAGGAVHEGAGAIPCAARAAVARLRAWAGIAGQPRRLRPGLEHEIEGRLGRPPETGEASLRTTSRRRVSPAWAPRASPTSWDSDAGAQIRVEEP